MPNKHVCQGPNCHTYPTTDRFLKSKGIIRGRYARLDADYQTNPDNYYYSNAAMDKYFCSQGCANSWLAENMESIARRTLPPFIEHRRITEGYQKVTTEHEGWNGQTYKSNSITRVDNRTEID